MGCQLSTGRETKRFANKWNLAFRHKEREQLRGEPVSRILSKGLPPLDDHSSANRVATAVKLPTRASRALASLRAVSPRPFGLRDRTPREAPIWHCSGWGLPCRSGCPSRGGLLPHRFTFATHAWQSLLCGAFPGVTPAGRYPAPLPTGVRTFLGPHPAMRAAAIRPSARGGVRRPRVRRQLPSREVRRPERDPCRRSARSPRGGSGNGKRQARCRAPHRHSRTSQDPL